MYTVYDTLVCYNIVVLYLYSLSLKVLVKPKKGVLPES